MKIYVGWDSREDIAYQVCKHSIKTRSELADVRALKQQELRDAGWYNRPLDKLASTEFTFTRFLIPELTNFEGWALFMDCDMLMFEDVSKLWRMRDDSKAIQVCKHNYTPKEDKKFLGQVQTKYEKKNWSSFMLMNCKKCSTLTPDYVNRASGLELHQFKWLESEELIGDLPLEWNWLVGEYEYKDDVKNVHYTKGGPWFEEYKDCDYAEEWWQTFNNLKQPT